MPTAYKQYETYYDEYEEAPPRRRRKRRRRGGGLIALILLAALIFGAYRLTDGFAFLSASAAPGENIENDFPVDLAALASMTAEADTGYYPEAEDMSALESLCSEREEYAERLRFLIDHIGAYSDTAVRNVLVSPEKIDYVLLSPFASDAGGGDIRVKKGKVPYLIQYDARWGYHSYGSGGIGYTGCGPTCLSMAVCGLTGEGSATPDVIADYAVEAGLYVPGVGTSWELFTKGAEAFGTYGRSVDIEESEMRDCLRRGEVLIASMLPGDFTRAGHFIVIPDCGLQGFEVYDPNCIERSERTWSYEELEPQMAALWSISR